MIEIYKAKKATPEVIGSLHKGEYFTIDEDGHKQVRSDFSLKMHPEKFAPEIVLTEVKIRPEEEQKMWEDVLFAVRFGSFTDQLIDVLKRITT